MIVLFIEYYQSSNDLVNRPTTSEVTSIVSENIENGTIEVNSSMFKSVTSYDISNNTTGVTISGSGIVSVIDSTYTTSGNGSQIYGYLNVDGTVMTNVSRGLNILFKSKLIIYTSSHSQANIKVTVGLFN